MKLYKNTILLLFGAVLGLVTPVYAQNNPQNVVESNSVQVLKIDNSNSYYVAINGFIDKNLVDIAISKLDASNNPSKILLVASQISEEFSVLRLARYIRENNIKIYVKGVCSDACAYLILPAASNVIIEKDSLISVRHNVYSSINYLKSINKKSPEKLSKYSINMENYFINYGISREYLKCAFYVSKPKLKSISTDGEVYKISFKKDGERVTPDKFNLLGIKKYEIIENSKTTKEIQNKIAKLKLTNSCS